MRVLLTGSSGYIGEAVARRLEDEAEVLGLDSRPGPFTTHIGDIGDRGIVETLLVGVEAVIHTASLHAPHVGHETPAAFEQTNVRGTRNLLDCALRASVQRFVYTSTTSVYGCSGRTEGPAQWVTEDTRPKPLDIYDTTKLKAEGLCREASGAGMKSICLRVSRCFPEAESLVAFYRLYRGVDKRDVAEGHLLALTAEVVSFDIFNLSGPTPFTVEDCERLWNDPWSVIEKAYPEARSWYQTRGWPRPKRIDRVYVIEKARRRLGYRPLCDFRYAVKQTSSIPL